jgi:hypothetical protein
MDGQLGGLSTGYEAYYSISLVLILRTCEALSLSLSLSLSLYASALQYSYTAMFLMKHRGQFAFISC